MLITSGAVRKRIGNPGIIWCYFKLGLTNSKAKLLSHCKTMYRVLSKPGVTKYWGTIRNFQ